MAAGGSGEPVPVEIGLVDLGQHPVRDFTREVRLYQVTAPGLAASFPPPRTTRRRHLPADRTPFIGRADEVREVQALVEASAIVSLVGPGGCGKTRLAFEVARR